MKKLNLLMKTLLMAVCLLAGASNALAQNVTWSANETGGTAYAGGSELSSNTSVVSIILGATGENWASRYNSKTFAGVCCNNNASAVTLTGGVPTAGTFIKVVPVKNIHLTSTDYSFQICNHYMVCVDAEEKVTQTSHARSAAATPDYGKLLAGNTYYLYFGNFKNATDQYGFKTLSVTSYESYTIHYKDDKGRTIKEDVVHEGLYGASVSATGSDLDPILYDEKSYAYSSGNTPIILSSGSNEITLVYAVAGEHAYTINAMDGSTKIQELASGTAVESEIYNISNLPIVIKKDGKYYKLSDEDVSGYAKSFTMGTTDREDAVEYTLDESIVYYSELEDVDVEYTTETVSAGYSNGKYAHVDAEGFPSITTLPHGKYSYEFYLKSDGNRGLYLRNIDKDKSENTIAHPSINKSSVAGKYSADFTLFDDTNLGLTGYINNLDKYNQSAEVDYVIIYKTDDVDDDVAAAIVDCETYETSAAFKSYIEGKYNSGDITTAAEVYAAHTAWQIAQAKASHSTDYSKVILNHAVTSTDKYWGTLSNGESAPYEGAPDNYYLYNAEGDEYNVNNRVYGIPAGKYEVSAYTYSSSADVRNLYVAIVDPWQDIQESNTTSAAGWVKNTTPIELSAQNNLAFGFFAGAITGRTAGFDNWTLTLTGEQVTVSDAGYATYVSSYDLDFTSTSIKAYKVKVTDKGVATLTQVNNVPAGTPVLLYKEGGATEFIPVMTGADAVSDNDLVPGTDAAVATIDGTYTNMILNNVNDQIGFYFANGKTVATNRAYLHIATSLAPDPEETTAPMLLVFANDDITGISATLVNSEKVNSDVYDLQGRKVMNPTKGLYIVNGKKVIIK